MEASAHTRKRADDGNSEEERKEGRVGREGRRTRRAARSLTAAWTDASSRGSDTYFCGFRRLKYTRTKPITTGRKYL